MYIEKIIYVIAMDQAIIAMDQAIPLIAKHIDLLKRLNVLMVALKYQCRLLGVVKNTPKSMCACCTIS